MRLGALVLIAATAWSAEALACSCVTETRPLRQQLDDARRRSGAIYLGEVTSTRAYQRAEVTVIEVFKGPLKPGDRLVVPIEANSCAIRFEPGLYLFYSGPSPTQIRFCSRSRPARGTDDVELAWLRGGPYPPTPAVLRREKVDCSPCDADAFAQQLAGDTEVAACERLPRKLRVSCELSSGQPFWAASSVRWDRDARLAAGRTKDGRFFELWQTPADAATALCVQRIQRRTCDALLFRDWAVPLPLECLHGTEWETVCDEKPSRRSEWAPWERADPSSCDWSDPNRPLCQLQERGEPAILPAGGVGMSCRPVGSGPPYYRCELERGPSASPTGAAGPGSPR